MFTFHLWATVACFVSCQSMLYTQAYKHDSRIENQIVKDPTTECTSEMFGGDTNAYWACVTQDVLHTNWYPSPISGLFTYQEWNGFDGFWQDGSVLESLASFNQYGNNSRYESILMSSHRDLGNLLHAYHPIPSYDDEMWYALSFAKIYEVTGKESFLDTSRQILNWTYVTGWDHSGKCSGGFWFDGRLSKKVTISNVQALQLAAKLYRLSNNTEEQYLEIAMDTWNYIEKNNVINPATYLVTDEIDPSNCKPFNKYNITYNAGVLLGGLAELYKITKNTTFLDIAHKVVNATMTFNTVDGILTEYCDLDHSCQNDKDSQMFKGIFMRNLRYIMDVSDQTHLNVYQKWIQKNIDSVLASSICTDVSKCKMSFPDGQPSQGRHTPVFGVNWRGPFIEGTPITQTSVLDLFTAGIKPITQCKGPACSYNPYFILPPRVDCKTAHCPVNYTCCTWDKIYNTCCTPQQTCYNGDCYP